MDNSFATPLPNNEEEAKPRTSAKGNNQEIRWEIVAHTPGITPAHIIVGRLHAEGIPARAWQEAAGQAYGITVGLLGTAYVAVPEEFADEALNILESEDNLMLDDVEFDEDDL
jgi:hypothetical protein